ncbi:MAG: V-type ATP synthase subunit D [Caldisericota bacterium]|jgi:V/A-type H+-transporting ATPase subunit D|nr:V-type ATP synthase subunit D [Caldisericota bacterium]
MILRVNPTRMELLRLRKRHQLAKRGHKLLKDKQEGLMKRFIELAEQYVRYQRRVSRELPTILADFVGQTAGYPVDVVDILSRTTSTELDVRVLTQSVMNVPLPKLTFSVEKFESPTFSGIDGAGIEASLLHLYRLLPSLMKVAEIETGIRLMADEIERTRRRVNALEYVMIPNLEETIRFISSKLDEGERATITRLLKIKEMILSH